MKDLLLENYIKEVMYDLYQEDLHEISLKNLKDFSPKTALETGLQVGTLSLLAFLGVEMNKSSNLPAKPKQQAVKVVKAAKDVGIKFKNSEETVKMLKDAFEEKPIEDIYKGISSTDMYKLRAWLSNKAGGYEVSVGDHILSREEFNRFNSHNDYLLNKGREPLTINKFVELIKLDKKVKQENRRISQLYKEAGDFPDKGKGIPSFDFDQIGLDNNNNYSPKQFCKDFNGLSDKIAEEMTSGKYDENSKQLKALQKISRIMTSSNTFISQIDEDGNWKDTDYFSAEEASKYYESESPEVKKIVKAYLSNDQ